MHTVDLLQIRIIRRCGWEKGGRGKRSVTVELPEQYQGAALTEFAKLKCSESDQSEP